VWYVTTVIRLRARFGRSERRRSRFHWIPFGRENQSPPRSVRTKTMLVGRFGRSDHVRTNFQWAKRVTQARHSKKFGFHSARTHRTTHVTKRNNRPPIQRVRGAHESDRTERGQTELKTMYERYIRFFVAPKLYTRCEWAGGGGGAGVWLPFSWVRYILSTWVRNGGRAKRSFGTAGGAKSLYPNQYSARRFSQLRTAAAAGVWQTAGSTFRHNPICSCTLKYIMEYLYYLWGLIDVIYRWTIVRRVEFVMKSDIKNQNKFIRAKYIISTCVCVCVCIYVNITC